MQGDLHVRFGGRLWETYHRKVARRPSPSLHVKYADEPTKLNIEMKDFLHDGEAVNRPNNSQEVYLKELGSESPLLVRLIMKSIHKDDKRLVKHIGCKRFGIQYLLKGIYTHNGLLYVHTELKNSSNVPFTVDFVSFKVVDRKVAKRTAIQEQVIVPLRAYNYVTEIGGKSQEQVIVPLRAYNYVTEVGGKSRERTVFTLPKFTLPDDKQLVMEINEQNGGRHQQFTVTNAELVRARVINELKVK